MSPLPYVSRGSGNPRHGLTLLELIVALGILAVLSTIAVRSLDPLADQTRFEATQRLLEGLREATVGSQLARQPSGQRIISGFVADTGRLPTTLADFTTLPAGIIAHSVQSFDSNRDSTDDVSLSSGWRGPYLQFGAGQTAVLDGWGRAPLIDPDGGIFDFTSLGSDNDSVVPEDGYRSNLTVTILPGDYTSRVTFRLYARDATTGARIDPAPVGTVRLGVLFYAVNANGGTTGEIQELLLPVPAMESYEVSRSNVIHGQAAARAISWSDNNLDQKLDAGESIVSDSYVHYFTVTSEADLRIELELR